MRVSIILRINFLSMSRESMMTQRAPLEEPLKIFSVGINLMPQVLPVAVIQRGTNAILVLYPSTGRTKEIRPPYNSISNPTHFVVRLPQLVLRMHKKHGQETMKILTDRRVKDW